MATGPLAAEAVACALRWARDNRRRIDFERDEWWTIVYRERVEREKFQERTNAEGEEP